MNEPQAQILEEWNGGFFYEMRASSFSDDGAARVLRAIESIDASILDEPKRRDVARIIWSQPFMALIYSERCVQRGGDHDAIRRFVQDIYKVTEMKMAELLA